MPDPTDTLDETITEAADENTSENAQEAQGAVSDPDLDESPQPSAPKPGEGLLTLQEIAQSLGVAYGRLRGFADTAGVKEAVGAVTVPGFKGVRYPPTAEETFRRITAAQDAGLVNPKTVAAMIQTFLPGRANALLQQSNNKGGMSVGNGLVPIANALLQQSNNGYGNDMTGGATAADLVEAMNRLASALQTSAPAAQVEQYFTLAGAAEATGLSQRLIKANVPHIKDGSRHKWAASDVRAFQASLPRELPKGK